VADNVELNLGSGGATIAADDVAGVHYQVVKIAVGADGAAALVSNANPIPVSDAGGSLTVDGTVAATQSGTWNVGTVTTVTTVSAVTAISNALPAGDNNIGNVDLASAIPAGTNNIGDVDVLTVVPGTGATNLGKAEDAAHTSGDVGVMTLFVRQDTQSDFGADGDYVPGSIDADGALRVSIVNGDISGLADDAAFTVGTTELLPVGYLADEASTDSVNEGDIGAPRITLDRKTIVTPYAHAAAGGATPYYNLDCDETEDAIKASAGKLFWIHVMNLANAKRYIKFYNATTANVTVGTTTPVLSFPIPTMADTNGAGFVVSFGDVGVQFDTAITVAATTGLADNDTGAPGANEIVLNAGYA
jgi:hypothetical protein